MSNPGELEPDDLLVRSRSALLDALQALEPHKNSVVVIGAQAVYLHTQGADVALAEATKDSDVALDPRTLGDVPLIERAMSDGGFELDPVKNQPGAWIKDGIPVDLMVPEALAGTGSRRRAHIPPHHKQSFRRARGLEAAIVDCDTMVVRSLIAGDPRVVEAQVAGPAALLIAKLHKIGERSVESPDRLNDKDAHDIYRLLTARTTEELSERFRWLLQHDFTAETAAVALSYLETLFAAGPDAFGSVMAGRAETGVGEPDTVALQTSLLAADLVKAIASRRE